MADFLKDQIPFNSRKENVYSMKEVSQHCDFESCWIIIHDIVYDVTPFLSEVRVMIIFLRSKELEIIVYYDCIEWNFIITDFVTFCKTLEHFVNFASNVFAQML